MGRCKRRQPIQSDVLDLSVSKRSKEEETFDFFGLPYVARVAVFSHLPVKDQLKTRLVCKELKKFVDERISRLGEQYPYGIVQDNGQDSFNNFSKKDPINIVTRLYVRNSSLSSFDDPKMKSALDHHRLDITTLRLHRFFVSTKNANQTKLIEMLPGLRVLQLDEIWLANSANVRLAYVRPPATTRRLQVLKLGKIFVYNKKTGRPLDEVAIAALRPYRKSYLRRYIWDVISRCTHIHYLKCPQTPKPLLTDDWKESARLQRYIRARSIIRNSLLSLAHDEVAMIFDIEHLDGNKLTESSLLEMSVPHKLEFRNIKTSSLKVETCTRLNAFVTHHRNCLVCSDDYEEWPSVNDQTTRPTLRSLKIKTSFFQLNNAVKWGEGPMLFPELEKLSIVIDTGFELSGHTASWRRHIVGEEEVVHSCYPFADRLLRGLFTACHYYSLHTLVITFDVPVCGFQRRTNPNNMSALPCIVRSFPNVENLTLVGWGAAERAYDVVLDAFPRLTKLTFISCPTLSATCFQYVNSRNIDRSLLKMVIFRGLVDMPLAANNNGLLPELEEILTELRLEWSSFLSAQNVHSRQEVWVRSQRTTY